MSKLILYLNTEYSREIEFEMLEYDPLLSFEVNCKLRQHLVEYNIIELKERYKQLIKGYEKTYKIILVHESKMNKKFAIHR